MNHQALDTTARPPGASGSKRPGVLRTRRGGRAHTFSKPQASSIRLLAGLGVEGDAYLGRTVQHRAHAARDPNRANPRQVHLINVELDDELRAQGFDVGVGDMGDDEGNLIRKAGVMAIVVTGGEVRPGDQITAEVPSPPHHQLRPV